MPGPVRPPSAGSTQKTGRKVGTVKNEGKLVLMFVLLIVLVYSVIIRKHIYMPVGTESDEDLHFHTKHGRTEKETLRAEFHTHRMDATASGKHKLFDLAGWTGGQIEEHTEGNGGAVSGVQATSSGITDGALWAKRRAAVVQATKETWAAYEKHAMGYDELLPLTKLGKNSFSGVGAMVVDTLDTLWLMGLRDEFDRARDWVSKSYGLPPTKKVSLFETTIRIVGGFLAAFDLSGDQLFLDKAKEVVDAMMPYFESSTTGIPPNNVVLRPSLRAGAMRPVGTSRAALAEYGTLALEFLALSERTNNAIYGQRAVDILKLLHERYPKQGMFPVWISRTSGRFTNNQILTVGAMGDSFYEYLLKVWLLLRKQGPDAELHRNMWERSMDDMFDRLLRTGLDGLMYVGLISTRPPFTQKMDHLACYLPGNLALGVAEGAVSGAKAEKYMAAARSLTTSCWHMYSQQPTGLSPEYVWFNSSSTDVPTKTAVLTATKAVAHPKVGDPHNDLRPEALESLFYMWRITGEQQYREWGWTIFESFQMYCRTPDGAFAGYKDVRNVTAGQTNRMETFWTAETLKYFWLLFGGKEDLPWTQWVLNTEAHPIRLTGLERKLNASNHVSDTQL
ncbi:hypothetical protein WJX73_010611 [Symbiochloris irregularis]|uniref:alpha-1,2-Mannosidase n=1 Tax=Symbiochloris irregularis TaxID=706552 RepID=A0AAW1P6J7_9CHLO